VNDILRLSLIVLAFVGASALTSQSAQRIRVKRNRPPVIESIEPDGIQFELCPFFESTYIINLHTDALDPDGDALTYQYSVSGGEILGERAEARWDVRKAQPGRQKVVVEVVDARGGRTSRSAEITIRRSDTCDPGCPAISVICPATVTRGDVATFEASVSGLKDKLTYLWSHSNGHRIPGTEASKIGIRADGSPGQVIIATLRIPGVDPACAHEASCESTIVNAIH